MTTCEMKPAFVTLILLTEALNLEKGVLSLLRALNSASIIEMLSLLSKRIGIPEMYYGHDKIRIQFYKRELMRTEKVVD